MLVIECSGSPYEIGLQHGQQARESVHRSIAFYADHFRRKCGFDWPRVQQLALEYEANIAGNWPEYLEEIRGIADGSGREPSDILALNVRTELAFGMFSDGCTSLSWLTRGASYLAQNWDWESAHKENLILMTVHQPPKPTIKMVTEAGLIGKIGLNSAGVGVCLNAIRAKGMDPLRIPCHLGLRLVLDSRSRADAVRGLSRTGVASSCHMLIADATGGEGVEWSSQDRQILSMNGQGQVMHSNHYLVEHPGVVETVMLREDTRLRVERMRQLVDEVGEEPSFEAIQALFRDEKYYPQAICRAKDTGAEAPVETLFNVVMNLSARRAEVILGRPPEPDELHELAFTVTEQEATVAAHL